MILVGEILGKVLCLRETKTNVPRLPYIFTSSAITIMTCIRAHVHVSNSIHLLYTSLNENVFENGCIVIANLLGVLENSLTYLAGERAIAFA